MRSLSEGAVLYDQVRCVDLLFVLALVHVGYVGSSGDVGDVFAGEEPADIGACHLGHRPELEGFEAERVAHFGTEGPFAVYFVFLFVEEGKFLEEARVLDVSLERECLALVGLHSRKCPVHGLVHLWTTLTTLPHLNTH